MDRVDSTGIQMGLLEQHSLESFLEVFSGSTITLRTYHIPGTCVPPLMLKTTGKKFYPHFTMKGGLRGVKFPKPHYFLVLLRDQFLACLNCYLPDSKVMRLP